MLPLDAVTAKACFKELREEVEGRHKISGKTFVQWGAPSGVPLETTVFAFQNADGWTVGDVMDVIVQGQDLHNLDLPVLQRSQRIMVTKNPDDRLYLYVGTDGWMYGMVISGYKAV